LAGRAVADSANGDIGTANQTYTTNNAAIQKAITDYTNAAAVRDAALQNSLTVDQQGTANTTYQNLINQAQNIGDTATAGKYLGDYNRLNCSYHTAYSYSGIV